MDRFGKSGPAYFVNQNTRHLNIYHTRDSLSVSVQNSWNLYWSDAKQKYVTSLVTLPSVNGRLGGRINPFKTGSNASPAGRLLDILVNKFAWSLSAGMNNVEYFDINTGLYKKTERSGSFALGLAKTFNFFNYFVYSPNLSIGDVRWTGRNLTTDEEGNFRQRSYSYLGWSENWSLNPLAFWKKPLVSASVSLNRQYTTLIFRSPDRMVTEYGDLLAHRMSFSGSVALNGQPVGIPSGSFKYSVAASADLMTKTNQRLDVFAAEHYGNLQQSFGLSLGWLSIQDGWSYSIPRDRSTLNSATANVLFGKFRIGFMKFDSFSAKLTWNNYFENARQNYLSAGYSVSFSPFPTFQMSVGVDSQNENLYLYDRSALREAGLPPSAYRNVFTDLADSFDFFDIAKRRKSNFKLRGISISFSHDLHCWELKGGYSLHQAYVTLPALRYARYPYWEHSLWIQIDLKAYQTLRYRKEETTAPPKTE